MEKVFALAKWWRKKHKVAPDWGDLTQIVRAFGMNPKVVRFESPSGQDIFCLKNLGTFTRKSIRVSEMNAVARAQLIFQMFT